MNGPLIFAKKEYFFQENNKNNKFFDGMNFSIFLVQNQNLLSNSQLEKNRIMLSFVCFTPQLPALLGQIIQLVIRMRQPEAGSLENIALGIGLICCVVSAQFVEELCLLMFCDDFRVHIRKQYSFFFKQSAENKTNTVTTHVSTIPTR